MVELADGTKEPMIQEVEDDEPTIADIEEPQKTMPKMQMRGNTVDGTEKTIPKTSQRKHKNVYNKPVSDGQWRTVVDDDEDDVYEAPPKDTQEVKTRMTKQQKPKMETTAVVGGGRKAAEPEVEKEVPVAKAAPEKVVVDYLTGERRTVQAKRAPEMAKEPVKPEPTEQVV